VTNLDPVELAMREIQRTSADNKPVGPNPFAVEPTTEVVRAILESAPQEPNEIEIRPAPTLASLPRDTAIALRWTLRDIDRKRTKFSPVSPADLKLLMEMGLVEMVDDTLSLTTEGHQAIG
jgi:hypothetical protein